MDLAGADLTDANLVGVDLTGANLTRARLIGANLEGANLEDANLTRASVPGASLKNANLTRADLTTASLEATVLIGANLSGANLSHAYLGAANLTGANLEGANLDSANLAGVNLKGVDLSKAKNVPPAILREHFKIEAPTSAAFRRWFGASVVVGDDNKPVVVYHGTHKGGFTEFKPEKRDRHHNAFYATDDIDVAETYVDDSEPLQRVDSVFDATERSGIYRLYIRLLNPMIVEGSGRAWDKLSDPRAPELRETHEFAKWAQEHGYDGVIFKNILDDGGQGKYRINIPATVYAVFDPKAIKSATANNGNYDPNDPDIRHNPRRSSSRAPRRR
jgi:hypothetical protein